MTYLLNKGKLLAFLVLGLLLVSLLYFYTSQNTGYSTPRTLRYSLEVQNTTNEIVDEARLWVYGPARQTSFQLSKAITASSDFLLTTDQLGNQIMEFKIKDLPPFGTKVINIEARLFLATQPQPLELDNSRRYLEEASFIESGHPDIQASAKALAKSDNNATLLSTYKWVSNHIKYSGFIKDDRGALYALKHRSGDCTEYAHLQTAMARANGIPSRSVGGYIVSEDAVLQSSDYHNWTEVYINSMWRMVDPQNKNYMEREQDYVVFRILGQTADTRLSNTHRFAYSDNSLNVKMY